jgi:hypothetical protein
MKIADKAKVSKVRDKLKLALKNMKKVSLIIEVSEAIKELDKIMKE